VTTDRDLVRLHWPVELRPALDAMFAIDDAMAEVVGTAREPMLAAIKLAWWRDSLEKLDREPPPAEPRLRAAAQLLLPRGIGGGALAGLEDGWAALLEEHPDEGRLRARGTLLFMLAARLLETSGEGVSVPGALWAEVDLARRFGRPLPAAVPLPPSPWSLRPLTALAALADRDARLGKPEAEATPARAWTLLRHRITGR
jgi:phytoene synthase